MVAEDGSTVPIRRVCRDILDFRCPLGSDWHDVKMQIDFVDVRRHRIDQVVSSTVYSRTFLNGADGSSRPHPDPGTTTVYYKEGVSRQPMEPPVSCPRRVPMR